MKQLILHATLVSLAAVIACNTDTGPTASACQANNTASVIFSNRSTSNTTYDVIWDGGRVATLATGQDSDTNTAAAGVQHTLVFKITNTNTAACSPSTPTLAQCSGQTFTCRG